MWFRLTGLLGVLILAVAAESAVCQQPKTKMKLTFGDKDAGKPTSPIAGQLVASGRYEMSPELTKPKVEFLVREKGKTGFVVHKAKLNKGVWEAKVAGLSAGPYEVRIQFEATNPETGTKRCLYLPDITGKPNVIEVVVQ